MSRETLKDANFRTIGFIDTDANGKQTARNAHFTTVGHYDPRTNWTLNAHFCRVSSGNTLSALIRCN
jgi:hypothetical protein